MKKSLLLASALLCAASSFAQDMTIGPDGEDVKRKVDPATYENFGDFKLENRWILSRNTDGNEEVDKYFLGEKNQVCSVVLDTTIYVARPNNGSLLKFGLASGRYLGETKLTVDGESIGTGIGALLNLTKDSFGHIVFHISAVQLAGNQLGEDVGGLGQVDDLSIGAELGSQVGLDGAGLGCDGESSIVGGSQVGEQRSLCVGGDEGLLAAVVDICEMHRSLSLFIRRQTGHSQVSGAVLHLAQDAVEVHGDDFQSQTQVIGDVLSQSHIEACQRGSAVLCDGIELIGSVVGAGSHGQNAGGNGLVGIICFGFVAAGAQGQQHGGGHQNGGQLHEFLHHKSLFSKNRFYGIIIRNRG